MSDRLTILKDLKKYAEEDKYCQYKYAQETDGGMGCQYCSVGFIMSQVGFSDQLLMSLGGDDVEQILDSVKVKSIPFFTVKELTTIQRFNDSHHRYDDKVLVAYIDELIKLEELK